MLRRSGYHSLKSAVEKHGVQVCCRGGKWLSIFQGVKLEFLLEKNSPI